MKKGIINGERILEMTVKLKRLYGRKSIQNEEKNNNNKKLHILNFQQKKIKIFCETFNWN